MPCWDIGRLKSGLGHLTRQLGFRSHSSNQRESRECRFIWPVRKLNIVADETLKVFLVAVLLKQIPNSLRCRNNGVSSDEPQAV